MNKNPSMKNASKNLSLILNPKLKRKSYKEKQEELLKEIFK